MDNSMLQREGTWITPWLNEVWDREENKYPQGSPEWFKLRETRITGSMCDILTGGSSFFTSWDEIVADKAAGADWPFKFTGNADTQRGKDLEDVVRKMYEERTGRVAHEFGLITHPTCAILAQSPDGISCKRVTDTRDEEPFEPILLEIKCPRKIKSKKSIPRYYQSQVQLGLAVFQLSKAHFVQYEDSTKEFHMIEVRAEEGWLERHMPTFERFWRDVAHYKEVGWIKNVHLQKEQRRYLYDKLPTHYITAACRLSSSSTSNALVDKSASDSTTIGTKRTIAETMTTTHEKKQRSGSVY